MALSASVEEAPGGEAADDWASVDVITEAMTDACKALQRNVVFMSGRTID